VGAFACRSHQPQRQLSAITALVVSKETLKTGRRVGHLQITAPPDFVCYVRRYIAGPVLDGIEANDPHRVVALTFHKVSNDGFEVGCLDIGLQPATAKITEIIEH
jgi:hypothetical protein